MNTKATNRVPVAFTLDKAAFVTVVVEDAGGRRVANLRSETYLPAGEHRVVWDGYDTGTETPGVGWERRRVAPREYRVRGLTHDGLKTIYEMPVYSPGTPPWFTADGSGAWLVDHSSPSSVLFLPSGSPEGGSQPQMRFGADVAEAGHALMWTDLKGRKITGAKVDGISQVHRRRSQSAGWEMGRCFRHLVGFERQSSPGYKRVESACFPAHSNRL